MSCVWKCQRLMLDWFYSYGYFVGSHPQYFLVVPTVVCLLLGAGLAKIEPKKGIEYLYVPRESRSLDEREIVRQTFKNASVTNFSPFSLNDMIAETNIIFRSKKEKAILTQEVIDEMTSFYKNVLAMKAESTSGDDIFLSNVCRKQRGDCLIRGSFVFDDRFLDKVQAGNVTYPTWVEQPNTDMARIFARVQVSSYNSLMTAGSFRLTFPLLNDQNSTVWELAFLELVQKTKLKTVDFSYAISDSRDRELAKATSSDIVFYSLTFTWMIALAALVSSGGDCVSARTLLAYAGMVAVGLGILGAFGLMTLCGVNFVSILGTMPFLTLGIGMDGMFLMMTCWSETLPDTDLTVPERMGLVYQKAGIGITITAVTDFLAFVIGSFSVFRSVRNFCIYSGAMVVMCYICNACVFGACLTFHAQRVYASRHMITCHKVTKSRKELRQEGAPIYTVYLCGGEIPTDDEAEQSLCERGPRDVLVRLVLCNPMRYFILLVFTGYLVVALWGCAKIRQGLDLKHLAAESSYYYKFQSWYDEDYGTKLLVSFVSTESKDYSTRKALEEMFELLDTAERYPLIMPYRHICWLTILARTPWYNTRSKDAFYYGLTQFLDKNPLFQNDIRFGPDKTITASRCHVYSKKITDSVDRADILLKMREVADHSPYKVFAYHPVFVIYEQFVVIRRETMESMGGTIAALFFVTCVFLPHPLMVVLVTVQILMITVGIFGFMAHWNLTLNSITMIELIMSVGFSVDFCAHVCIAYMVSEEHSREDRAKDAIVHASGSLFNGGLPSLSGICMLAFSNSYIFQSFFKIMLLVIGFSIAHAVFLIPVVLSFIGPSTRMHLEDVTSPSLISRVRRKSMKGVKLEAINEIPNDTSIEVLGCKTNERVSLSNTEHELQQCVSFAADTETYI